MGNAIAVNAMNKYKCDHSPGSPNKELDLICRGCLRAWIGKHDLLVEFVKHISEIRNDVLDEDMYIGVLDGVIDESKSLLKIIGEI